MLKQWPASIFSIEMSHKEPLSASVSNQADYWKLDVFISSTSRNLPPSGNKPFWQLWVRVKGRKSDRFVWLENKTRENTSATSYILKQDTKKWQQKKITQCWNLQIRRTWLTAQQHLENSRLKLLVENLNIFKLIPPFLRKQLRWRWKYLRSQSVLKYQAVNIFIHFANNH